MALLDPSGEPGGTSTHAPASLEDTGIDLSAVVHELSLKTYTVVEHESP